MSEITKDTFKKPTPHPIFFGMPEHLKNPDNYEKIQKTIIESLAGKCSHGEIIEWAGCPKCQKRFAERGQVIKKLGFSSMKQYMAWQKVHQEIRNLNRVAFAKYDD